MRTIAILLVGAALAAGGWFGWRAWTRYRIESAAARRIGARRSEVTYIPGAGPDGQGVVTVDRVVATVEPTG